MMKVQLEKILFQGSINFFVRESSQFQPYWHYHPEIEITLITKETAIKLKKANKTQIARRLIEHISVAIH